ncbi:acyl-CoA thioesterase [Salinibaculum rarum]|uniref:acyl-CoA thioesterase n=1 Tax=Salinibaculum rarum TaxID=3058903 RepID=UPI00265F9216|nr:acyl-CoA thioesterase [Salinibaculum sp. KK48]
MSADDGQTARLSQSHTEMTELLMPDDTNFFGRALGGAVLHWMDICGAIAAMRFSNSQCVTASMDHVDFISPIELGEIVVVQAYAFDTGQTSVDVKVDVMAEEPRTGESRDTTSSFLTFVAVDEDGTPTEVPELVCESDAEREHRDSARDQRQDQLETLIDKME